MATQTGCRLPGRGRHPASRWLLQAVQFSAAASGVRMQQAWRTGASGGALRLHPQPQRMRATALTHGFCTTANGAPTLFGCSRRAGMHGVNCRLCALLACRHKQWQLEAGAPPSTASAHLAGGSAAAAGAVWGLAAAPLWACTETAHRCSISAPSGCCQCSASLLPPQMAARRMAACTSSPLLPSPAGLTWCPRRACVTPEARWCPPCAASPAQL